MRVSDLRFPSHAGTSDDRALSPLLVSLGVLLRRALDSDIPWLCELYASTRHEELVALNWPLQMVANFVDSQFSLQHQHYVTHYADADFWIVEREGRSIGRYYVTRGNPIRIIDISLMQEARGLGIGSALISASQAQATLANSEVVLHVLQSNFAAARLYKKLGFVPTAQVENTSHIEMRWQPPSASAC